METQVIDAMPSRRGKRAGKRERLVLSEITAAREALAEARGRFVEAQSGADMAAVVAALEQVRAHVDTALGACRALGKKRGQERTPP